MPYYLLMYEVAEDYLESRAPHREKHLAMAKSSHAHGEIVLAGAYGDPPVGAVLVFRADDAAAVEQFAREDPYVRNGVVTTWRVQPWHVVIGAD